MQTMITRRKATNSNLQMVQLSKLSAHTRFPYGGECYVVKSAEKIRLEEEQQQLQESNDWLILSDVGEPVGYKTLGSSLIEYLFHPIYKKLLAFKWIGPDPLSISTQASDLFFYMLAFTFSNKVHWVEFRLVRFDRKSSESIREHLFFLPRVETVT
ncbi:unnamed protein product [Penicillium camemberti]|uniref:Str. FM013 n=1 Tax=Penicillium camemberti (strain FM 013) TaxID=1429867 RepID=A0A0G4PMM5_PENC3|nr:unnamed protein product [Penicillium camemberti]